jgi:hypothetical protein
MPNRSNLALAAFAALMTLSACADRKPTWTAFDAGPLSIEFPCSPKKTDIGAKCMRSDGAEYALRTVQKDLTPEEQLAEARAYMHEIPKGEVLADGGFPLRWREVRQFFKLESVMYYEDGKEMTLSVQYNTQDPPKETDEFFARAKPKKK